MAKLKAVFDKNKKNVIKGDVTKPEEPKVKPELTKKPPFGRQEEEPEEDTEDQDGEDGQQSPTTPAKPEFKKKPNPLAKKIGKPEE